MRREYVYSVIVAALLVALLLALFWPRAQPTVILGNCPSGTNNGIVAEITPFRIYWCQPEVDHLEGAKIQSGLPTSPLQLDNVRIERGPITDNLVQWSAAVPAQPRGQYSIVLVAQNFKVAGDPSTVQEGPGSAPFGLGVGNFGIPAPAAPFRLRLDQGPVTQSVGPPVTNRRP